jgi:hypothetical protein
MNPELQAEIEKARTAAVAATCCLTDSQILLADLTDKSRIVDSQIEHLHGLIARFEAIAEAWSIQVKRVADISHFDVELQKLTARILNEAGNDTQKEGGQGRETEGTYAEISRLSS